jgi:hypothetical protein
MGLYADNVTHKKQLLIYNIFYAHMSWTNMAVGLPDMVYWITFHRKRLDANNTLQYPQ